MLGVGAKMDNINGYFTIGTQCIRQCATIFHFLLNLNKVIDIRVIFKVLTFALKTTLRYFMKRWFETHLTHYSELNIYLIKCYFIENMFSQ